MGGTYHIIRLIRAPALPSVLFFPWRMGTPLFLALLFGDGLDERDRCHPSFFSSQSTAAIGSSAYTRLGWSRNVLAGVVTQVATKTAGIKTRRRTDRFLWPISRHMPEPLECAGELVLLAGCRSDSTQAVSEPTGKGSLLGGWHLSGPALDGWHLLPGSSVPRLCNPCYFFRGGGADPLFLALLFGDGLDDMTVGVQPSDDDFAGGFQAVVLQDCRIVGG